MTHRLDKFEQSKASLLISKQLKKPRYSRDFLLSGSFEVRALSDS
jgi:hypothetical protein